MAELSYPVADGGAVTEFKYEQLVGQSLGEGRYDPESISLDLNPIVYADSTGRHVKLRAGTSALVRGFRWEAGADPVILPLAANTTGLARLDLIVLRLDRESYTVRAVAIQGAPSSTPIAPSPLRQLTENGKYDVPLATVRVTSSNTTGLPSIATSDVTTLEMRIAPQPRMGRQAAMRAMTHPAGAIWTEMDAGMVWANAGVGSVLLGERGAYTKLGVVGGWTNDNMYAIRRNGWTMLQGWATLGNAGARAPSQATNICTLPDLFRPVHDISGLLMMSPTQLGRLYIESTTGLVSIVQFKETFPAEGGFVMQPITFVSKGV